MLIITDDLALPYGTLRLRGKGSGGGHNGLGDIEKVLGHNKYSRLRFGIGDEFSKGQQVDYVLGKWTIEENQTLQERLERSSDLAKSFATIGLERTMNFFNNT
jgi:PTH1 family peptidyl-tRNA hydrolase